MSPLIDTASWLLLMSGCFCVLVSAIGLLRMPDLFTRMHAAGIGDTLGAILIIAGLLLQAGPTLLFVKLVMILFLPVMLCPMLVSLYLLLRPLIWPQRGRHSILQK